MSFHDYDVRGQRAHTDNNKLGAEFLSHLIASSSANSPIHAYTTIISKIRNSDSNLTLK